MPKIYSKEQVEKAWELISIQDKRMSEAAVILETTVEDALRMHFAACKKFCSPALSYKGGEVVPMFAKHKTPGKTLERPKAVYSNKNYFD